MQTEVKKEVLWHYGKRIRLASLENGQVSKDTEEKAAEKAIAALADMIPLEAIPYEFVLSLPVIRKKTIFPPLTKDEIQRTVAQVDRSTVIGKPSCLMICLHSASVTIRCARYSQLPAMTENPPI